MMIEIDGYEQQVLLIGPYCSLDELREKYKTAKRVTQVVKVIPAVICALYSFQQVPYQADVQVTYVIDTDTDRIYAPSYSLNDKRR